MTIVRLEYAQLLRSRAVVTGVLLLAAAGAFAIAHGRSVIAGQQHAIAASAALQREQHQAILGVVPPTAIAGDQAYYLRFFTAHEPSAWAPVSIGQRDVQPFNLKVRLLSIHGQLYDAELNNPLLSAFGNFDLAFVLVFLVPLVSIALTYNLWSSERELGTWDLVRSQPASPLWVLGVKLAVRGSVVVVPAVALVIAAAVMLGLPWDWRLGAVLLGTVVYALIWLAAAVLIGALGRSSDFNLVALLAVWVVWTILGPAFVTMAVSARYPIAESLEIAVRQRQGYHASWDRRVQETMALFYERHPQWRHVPVPDDRYSNAWYYGMQHRGDLEAEPAAAAWREAIERRERWTARLVVLFPPVLFQRALNATAATDLASHLAYLDSVIAFHERLEAWYVPANFDNRTVAAMDWGAAPVHAHRAAPDAVTVTSALGALAFVAVLLAAIGAFACARQLTPRQRRRAVAVGTPAPQSRAQA